jgi:hypothetical protein
VTATSSVTAFGVGEQSALQIEANRARDYRCETRNFDSTTFNAWFMAYTLDNPEKMTIAKRRFRARVSQRLRRLARH